jgi:hypothetical protein
LAGKLLLISFDAGNAGVLTATDAGAETPAIDAATAAFTKSRRDVPFFKGNPLSCLVEM